MGYNFTATWVKGLKNDAPDALSHHPVHDPLTTDALAELDIHDHPDMSIAEIRTISDQHNEAYACKSCSNTPNKMISTNYCGTSY